MIDKGAITMDYSEWVREKLPSIMKDTGLELVPGDEIISRVRRLKEKMHDNGVDSFLVLQKMDCYYFSGTTQDAMIFIPLEGHPLLIVKREIERARIESPLSNIVSIKSIKELPQVISQHNGNIPDSIATELDVLPVKEYFILCEHFKGCPISDGSRLVKDVRKIKSEWEIQMMRKAGEIGLEVYNEAREFLREGLSEVEFAGMMELHAKKMGHEGLIRVRSMNYEAYSWHILSGWSGAIVSQSDSPMGGLGMSPAFPVGASRRLIRSNEPVLVDFGICYHGYQIDETRMFSVGALPSVFVDAYKACCEILMAVLEEVRPGVYCHELFEKGLELAEKLGYGDNYLGPSGLQTSFVGHGLGLELNEYPFIAKGQKYPLEKGMTFAPEPKMVFPGKGAVGVEDTVLVTENGYEILTPVSREIFIK